MSLWKSILEFQRILLVLFTAAIGVIVVSALTANTPATTERSTP